MVLSFEVDIAFNPGAEVVCAPNDIVFGLAGLNTTQATDALGGINAIGPTMLCPVVIICGE